MRALAFCSWIQFFYFLLCGSALGCHEPQFMIIGAQKGGTTAARYNLRQHPDIVMKEGELHWFDKHGTVSNASFNDYLKRLKEDVSCTGHQLLGDSAPIYMYDPVAMYAIRRYLPHLKLIISLRDPVERVFSQYLMSKYQPPPHSHHIGNHTSFEDILKMDMQKFCATDHKVLKLNNHYPGKGDYLNRGLYVEQLERISSLFPREQMHFMCSEEIRDTLDYNATFRFLGVKPIQLPDSALQRVSDRLELMSEVTKQELIEFYRPWNELLIEWLQFGPSHHRQFVHCIRNWA